MTGEQSNFSGFMAKPMNCDLRRSWPAFNAMGLLVLLSLAFFGLVLIAKPVNAQKKESSATQAVGNHDPKERIANRQVGLYAESNRPCQNDKQISKPLSPGDASVPKPFAYYLFLGAEAWGYPGPGPDTIIQPGDSVHVVLYGGLSFEGALTVDPHGNISLPKVGSIPVRNIRGAELQSVIESAVRRARIERVHVYADLMSLLPVGVYVTGFVDRPGHYYGDRMYGVLSYLIMAGGVDPWCGSFRSVRVIRNDRTLVSFDLYDFKIKGKVPLVRMEEGDHIVVDPVGNVFTAVGKVRNHNRFEFRSQYVTGSQVTELARPAPGVSHVSVRGIRGNQPFNTEVSIKYFQSMRIYDQDQVRFSFGLSP